MFFKSQSSDQKQKYERFLKVAGSLSNLFSDSENPYLNYRIAEKIFCRAFEAEDLSRSDVSADAKKDNLGIGLKTFLIGRNKSFQKVAEFNGTRDSYAELEPKKMVKTISELRNARIKLTENIHGLNKSIYHCVIRDKGKFKIFEETMDTVDIDNIKIEKKSKSSIIFNDGKNDYSFLISKSTLTKRFIINSVSHEFDVVILKDPLSKLYNLIRDKNLHQKEDNKIKETIYLPLYGKNKLVYERSGLNQWNARGRERNPDEVYIPIPSIINKNCPSFFPDRDNSFSIILPNGDIMKAKVCQDNRKALMSYSNKELGKWILRDVLNLRKGELLTYKKLQTLGIDSVRIDKMDNLKFKINFAKIDSYEEFEKNFFLKS